jgi:putative chitinase
VPDLADAAKLCRNPQKLANRVYANRLGNGDEASGDGWAFRGSGMLQLTGRLNFRRSAAGCGRPYETDPQLVRQPAGACLTAAWYWASILGNELADTSQIDVITARIAGPAMLGADERRSRFDDNLRALA